MKKYAFRLFVAIAALAATAVVPPMGDASGVCDLGTSVAGGGAGPGLGWHVGTGQCNGDFTVVSDAAFPGDTNPGIELGLRIEQRSAGQLNPPQHNGSSYEVQTGTDTTQPNPNRAWWNFHHSIAYKSGIETLDALTFTIRTDVGTSVPLAPSYDMLALRPFIDARIAPKAAGGYSDVYQTSQNPFFSPWFATCTAPNVPAGCFDANAPGAWTLTLTAVKDAQVATVTICVHTPGQACAAPPAPPAVFDDLRRGNDITAGADLCGTGHSAINFTGQTGSGGDTWITLYDPAQTSNPYIVSDDQTIRADVIIKPFNNKKGAGVLALYNAGANKKGLALIASDAGNTDSLTLALVDQQGKLTTLKSVVAVNGITLCKWYRVELKVDITGADTFTATGNLYKHSDGSDPSSAIVATPVATLTQPETTLSINGLQSSGEVGIIASAVSAVVDTSVTNFTLDQP